MSDLFNTMRSNPQAFNLICEARSNKIIAEVAGIAGSGLIVFPFVKAYFSGHTYDSPENINWTPSIIGGTLIAITIRISLKVTEKRIQAVHLYNSTFFQKYKPEFKVQANNNGIGLLVHF